MKHADTLSKVQVSPFIPLQNERCPLTSSHRIIRIKLLKDQHFIRSLGPKKVPLVFILMNHIHVCALIIASHRVCLHEVILQRHSAAVAES
jgi:hypothetical protein